MLYRAFALLLGVLFLTLAACDDSSEERALRDAERQLVDAYVRLSVLEVLHRDHPDSVETLLRNGVVYVDTLAVLRAADSLSVEPLRWEFVFDAITKRLEELERVPDEWWSVARGDSHRTTE